MQLIRARVWSRMSIMTVSDLIVKTIVEGGPYAISAVGRLAWWYERKLTKDNQDRMFDLAGAQIAKPSVRRYRY